jgi:hypothetical protein
MIVLIHIKGGTCLFAFQYNDVSIDYFVIRDDALTAIFSGWNRRKDRDRTGPDLGVAQTVIAGRAKGTPLQRVRQASRISAT